MSCGKNIGKPKNSNAYVSKHAKKKLPPNVPTVHTTDTAPMSRKTSETL